MMTILPFLDTALAETLGWTALHALWQGAAATLLMRGGLYLAQGQSAAFRYRLAYSTLLFFCIGVLATFASLYDAQDAQTTVITRGTTTVVWHIEAVPASASSWGDVLTTSLQPLLPSVVVVWVLGALFFMLRLLGGYGYGYHLRRRASTSVPEAWHQVLVQLKQQMGIHRPIQVRLSAQVVSPLIMGYVRPYLLLPVALVNQLSVAQVEAVLAHELAHVARHDVLANWVQCFIEAVFYYHPGVWWMGAEIRNLREQAADAMAIQHTANSVVYARTLLQVAAQAQAARPPVLALGFLGRRQQPLLTRVQHIFQQPIQQQTDMREKFAVTGLLVLLALVVSWGAGSPDVAAFSSAEPFPMVMPLDTFPKGKITMNTVEDGTSMKVTVNNGVIEHLEVNGKVVPKAEYPQYDATIAEKFANMPPPPPAPPAPPAPMAVPGAPAPPAPPRVMMMKKNIETIRKDDGTIEVTVTEEAPAAADRKTIIWMDADGQQQMFNFSGGEEFNFDNIVLGDDMPAEARAALEKAFQSKEMEIDMQLQALEALESADFAQVEADMARHISGDVMRTMIVERKTDDNWLGHQLKADGLITDAKTFSFKLDDKRLKIDGKTMPTGVHQRYKQLYERHSGLPLGEGSSISVKKSGN